MGKLFLKRLLPAALIVAAFAWALRAAPAAAMLAVAVNLCGWCVAWGITHVLGLPRDGSLRSERGPPLKIYDAGLPHGEEPRAG